jgi:hypothetical protein
MPAENSRKYAPPYISPVTFRHLLEQLQKSLPDRIDRSYLDELHSGSTGTQIMSAIRYLSLVDNNNKPTPNLRFLLDGRATPEERTKKLRDIAVNAYGFILNNTSINLKNATYAQLQELFHDHCGVDGDVRRKCIKFFISFTNDAGIQLSTFINKRVRMAQASSAPRTAARKASSRNPRSSTTPEVPQIAEKIPEPNVLLEILIGKFPEFDVKWTAEQKTMWLESFSQLMQKILPPAPLT